MSDERQPNKLTYAMLRPAARLALLTNVSLRDVKKFAELAYYQEAKRRGLKMKEIKELLSISMSKVGLLSKELKEHFIEPETQHGIGRQILSLLWAAPLTEGRIVGALPEFEPDEVIAALKQLTEEGRIVCEENRTNVYRLAAASHRLTTDPWMAKIDGLNTLLQFVSRAVESRFLDGDDRSMVRNVAFRVRPEDLGKLKTFYEEQLFPLVVELDDAVDADGESVPIRLSILWAPEEGESQ